MSVGGESRGPVSAGTMTLSRVGVEHVEKSFGNQHVLRDVSLTLVPGELNTLLGANGSGKSTLVKILCGTYQPDAGQIFLGDVGRLAIKSPQQAQSLGVRVVHQEAPLIDSLSVAECMALFRSYPMTRYGRVRWRNVYQQAQAEFARFDVDIDPKAMAGTLTPSQRAYVALSVALGDSDEHPVSLVVLDEVSASIPESEAEPFLTSIRQLARTGIPVLMVTHRLAEVERYADQMTILRDGVVVGQGPVQGVSRQEIISLMTGGAEGGHESAPDPPRTPFVAPARPTSDTRAREPWLEVTGLTTTRLRDVAFEVRPGEVLGFVGGPESGVEDVPLALAGLTPTTTTSVTIDGQAARLPRSPRHAMKMGISLVPRDRLHQGIVGSFTVEENIVLPRAANYWHRTRHARRVALDIINRFDVRPPDPRRLAAVLSGGNQQKVIIGKWLNCRPLLLILDDPGMGVDPRARQEIFAIINEAVDEGISVVMLSTEPEELAAYCTRVLALSGGQAAKELTGDELSYETLARWAVS